MKYKYYLLLIALVISSFSSYSQSNEKANVHALDSIVALKTAAILTPKQGPEPRINGPKVFGVRPENPIVFTIPASGDRPMTFSVAKLPKGVKLDAQTGRLSG